LGTCVGIISQLIGGRKLCAPTVTDFVHNVGANCVRPKGTLSKRRSLIIGRSLARQGFEDYLSGKKIIPTETRRTIFPLPVSGIVNSPTPSALLKKILVLTESMV
ncbi:MAG: hypothetical protein ACK4WI_11235, partial [Microcystis sp.]